MKFYHLTKKENVENILINGIQPKCGENTQMVEKEIGNYIFLTSKKDLEIWSLFLNRHYVIEVELDYRPKRRTYSNYAEYYTENSINSNCIVNHYEYNPTKVTKHTKDLLVSYMEYIAFTCEDYLDLDPTSKNLNSINDRKFSTNILKVVATNPIYFNNYLNNAKELYKSILGGYLELLKERILKENNKEIKSNLEFFIDYLEKCC